MNSSNKGFSTIAIHSGKQLGLANAHLTPIFATSTYTFDNATQAQQRFTGEDPGNIYGRFGSPTIAEAEEKIAALETFTLKNNMGEALQAKAILHSSGMGALTTLLLSTLKQGDAVLSHYSLYGGTQEVFDKVLPELGITIILVNLQNLQDANDAFAKHNNIKLLYLETPANPTLQCVDIKALTAIAKQYGVLTAADNTFATPYLQQPFAYGVNFIMHSTTKFLNGHGTAIGGVLIGTDINFMQTKATKWHRLLGANSNGLDAFLLSTGIKTIALRMEQHCNNAMDVANYLQTHAAISKVNYLGLAQHPQYALAKLQMKHPGAMLSFEILGGYDACITFLNKIKLITHAVSLGTIDTLVTHPASTTHFGVSEANRALYGITNGLIRMSVGIENIEDILADLQQALA